MRRFTLDWGEWRVVETGCSMFAGEITSAVDLQPEVLVRCQSLLPGVFTTIRVTWTPSSPSLTSRTLPPTSTPLSASCSSAVVHTQFVIHMQSASPFSRVLPNLPHTNLKPVSAESRQEHLICVLRSRGVRYHPPELQAFSLLPLVLVLATSRRRLCRDSVR